MSDNPIDDLIERFDDWQEHRTKVSSDEERGDADSDDWAYSDDTAVELLEEAILLLKGSS